MADFSTVVAKVQALAVAAVTTLRGAQMHGELDDPEFPAAHFHRGMDITVPESDYRTGDTGLNRSQTRRYRKLSMLLRVGYLFGRDEAAVGTTVRSSFAEASIDAQGDMDTVEAALTQSTAWSGTTPAIVAIRRVGPTTVTRVMDLSRAIAAMPIEVEVSIT